LTTLPAALRGRASRIAILRGARTPRRSRAQAERLGASTSPGARSSTAAAGISPWTADGIGKAAAPATAGCSSSTRSISEEKMLMLASFIMSSLRPR